MNSDSHIDSMAKRLIKELGLDEEIDKTNKKYKNSSNKKKCKVNLSASNILVIAGLLSGALEVESLLVDKNQEIQIILAGSLKQKSQLEKVMDHVGTMPFDEVVKAMINRF